MVSGRIGIDVPDEDRFGEAARGLRVEQVLFSLPAL